MTAELSFTPNPASPSTVIAVTGSGLTDAVPTRLVLGSTVVSGIFTTTSGGFNLPVTLGPSTRRRNLLAQQKPHNKWTVAASVPVDVQTPAAFVPRILTFAAAPGSTTVTVSWTLDQPATGQVEYGPVASPQTFPFLSTLEPNLYPSHSQDISGLAAGTAYRYRLRSGNANGSAALVEHGFATASAAASAPGAPTGLTATPGDTIVDLAWVTPASNGGSAITGYKVYRAGVLIATVGVVNVFHDVGRTNGVSYSYTVKAVNVAGDSTASGSASATPAASGLVFPPDRNPLIYKAETIIALPGTGSGTVDPDWNTHLRRLGASGSWRHSYSRQPVENSDMTKILMGWTAQTGGSQAPRLLHGTTYADLGAFPGGMIDMAIWSNTDPNKVFGVENSNGLFRSQNVTTGVRTTIHDFSGTYAHISIGNYEGGISDDDKYVALIGTTAGGAEHIIVLRIDNNSIVADIVAPANLDNVQISRLGNYVIAVGGGYTTRYLQNLTSPITLSASGNHGDNALDAAGNEIFVTNAADVDGVQSYRLSTGARTTILAGRTAFEAGHTSGGPPGWVGLSNYDETFYGTNNVKPGRNQLAALKTDGSQTLRVFGHARHLYDNSNPDRRYTNEPQARLSRDGTRMFFTTNWRDASSWGYPMVAYP